MSTKIRPIRDLFFRFIQDTEYEGLLDAQQAALELSKHGFIELIANHSNPTISHYRDSKVLTANDLELVLERFKAKTGKLA